MEYKDLLMKNSNLKWLYLIGVLLFLPLSEIYI